jgi:hypothetical protein
MFALTAAYFGALLLGGAAVSEWLQQLGSYLFRGGTADAR